VRRAIGHDVIERNEALHQEVAALAEIVDEFRAESYSLAEERRKRAAKRDKFILGGGTGERRLLEQQIRLLLDDAERGRARQPAPLALPPPVARSEEDAKVLEYLSSDAGGGGGGGGAGGLAEPFGRLSLSLSLSQPNTGRPVSALASSRGRNSARSCPAAGLAESLGGQLSAGEVGHVAEALRRAFSDERAELLEEVETLNALFEDEHAGREQLARDDARGAASVPSTSELRAFRQRLAQEQEQHQREALLSKRPPPLGGGGPGGLGGFPGGGGSGSVGGPGARPAALGPLRPVLPAVGAAPRVPALNIHRAGQPPDSSSSTSADKPPRVDCLKRPPLPAAGKGVGGSSKLSSRMKSTVAEGAATARDDFHLSGDDERFFT